MYTVARGDTGMLGVYKLETELIGGNGSCDVIFANENEIENELAFKHFSLVHLVLLINESFRHNYAKWIFAFLGYRWWLFPEEYYTVVNQTADFINGLRGETTEITEFLQGYLLQKYTDYLPAPFVYSLINSPVFDGKWESRNPYGYGRDYRQY